MNTINSIVGVQNIANNPQHKHTTKKAKSNSSKIEKQDVIYEKSNNLDDSVNSDYSHLKNAKYTINKAEIEAMKAEMNERMKAGFLQVVKEFIGQQNIGYKYAIEIIFREGSEKIKPKMVVQAKQDIAEGGYWSAEKTSQRILEFAKTISGGDPQKANMLKEAFLKGFEEAEKAWGNDLPEICKKTKEAVLEGFKEWETIEE
ncbi:hypothetical protein PV797_01690 [Clostridiaceae bacterium M8S5]|nr:hypothetical protein PV797_01690 [Clostridiaceae bacterium M8S5]